MKKGPKYIPTPLYKKILEVMPIPCVDIVVIRHGKFLLGKRINKPARGAWWFIGGRVMKGERLVAAVRRHVAIETGIKNIKIKKFLTTRETIFKNSAQGPASHTINTLFLVEAPSENIFMENGENSDIKWFSRINRRWPSYVRGALRLAGYR